MRHGVRRSVSGGGKFAWTYHKAARYIQSLAGDAALDPVRVGELLLALGSPETTVPSVHVVTGATAVTPRVAAALHHECGLSVGLFLTRAEIGWTHRITVDGELTTPDELATLSARVLRASPRVVAVHGRLTRAELLLAIAFELFVTKGVDIAIVEAEWTGTRQYSALTR